MPRADGFSAGKGIQRLSLLPLLSAQSSVPGGGCSGCGHRSGPPDATSPPTLQIENVARALLPVFLRLKRSDGGALQTSRMVKSGDNSRNAVCVDPARAGVPCYDRFMQRWGHFCTLHAGRPFLRSATPSLVTLVSASRTCLRLLIFCKCIRPASVTWVLSRVRF